MPCKPNVSQANCCLPIAGLFAVLIFSTLGFFSTRGVAQEHQASASSASTFDVVKDNVALSLALDPVDPRSKGLHENEDVFFRFRMHDAVSGAPITGLHPAAWMSRHAPGDHAPCAGRIAGFLGAKTLAADPDLDLTGYLVLSLNADATFNVILPHFHSGQSRVLTTVPLESPGEDWAVTPDQSLLFISLPGAKKVAVVRTASWKVISNISLGASPHRLAIQPDGHYVWIAEGPPGDREVSGVRIVSGEDARFVANIPTGKGKHDIAFSSDSHLAFVTNDEDATVSIIDIRHLRKLKDIKLGGRPASIAFSGMAKLAYVTDRQNGRIVVIDGETQRVVQNIQAEPGIGLISFAPSGRLAFVLNVPQKQLLIVDASENRVLQWAPLAHVPDRVAFSARLAYITHLQSDLITMVPLDRIGVPDAPVPVIDLPAAPSSSSLMSASSRGDSIVQAPGEDAVLVLDAQGDSIYYYEEGMAAPMGIAGNAGHVPQAILVMEQSLVERSPGLYETSARLGSPGDYVLALFVDSPKIVTCFDVVVNKSSEVAKRP
jgi:DNA-binding beta-propeller fold protein YncE